jgi:hypothetical protein
MINHETSISKTRYRVEVLHYSGIKDLMLLMVYQKVFRFCSMTHNIYLI